MDATSPGERAPAALRASSSPPAFREPEGVGPASGTLGERDQAGRLDRECRLDREGDAGIGARFGIAAEGGTCEGPPRQGLGTIGVELEGPVVCALGGGVVAEARREVA